MEIPEMTQNEKEFSDKINFVFVKGDPTDEDGDFYYEKFPYIILSPKYDNLFGYEIGIYMGNYGGRGLCNFRLQELKEWELEKILKNLVGYYSHFNEKLSKEKFIDLKKEKEIKVFYTTDELIGKIK